MDIKETKEMLVAVDEVGLTLVKILRDGVQPVDDFKAFFTKVTTDVAFEKVLKDAWDAHEKIPDELKDLSLFEMADLAKTEIEYVPKFIAALKG